MRYLAKHPTSEAMGLGYPMDAVRIRQILVEEQAGYCAYTEKWLSPTESVDVDHFDPRLKHTSKDGYDNWYAVLHWQNLHRPRSIEPFLPLADPTADLSERVVCRRGIFYARDPSDLEASNLIQWLGWNLPDLVRERLQHVSRIRRARSLFSSPGELLDWLRSDPPQLSFASTLRAELALPL